jgi:hypothetical protein
MKVLAIDPGPENTAFVFWNGCRISAAAIRPNEAILEMCRLINRSDELLVAIEMIASYGMAVGASVFETCVFIGRLIEALEPRGIKVRLIFRRDIKLHHCLSTRANDSNVRQALIDKYGAPGTKKAPGLTYGIKKDLWAALAIATYVTETKKGALRESTA